VEGRRGPDKEVEPSDLSMSEPSRISQYEAEQYDEQCRQMEWRGHEALFDMTFEYLTPGQSVLDLGIGTGLNAVLYHKAGLDVYGVDNSEEMLGVCTRKGVARGVKVCDLSQPGWPCERETFDHVTSCGLFHFIGDLDIVFAEVRRALKASGTFGFTVKGVIDGKTEYVDSEYKMRIYCHDEDVVDRLIVRHGFELMKKLHTGRTTILTGRRGLFSRCMSSKNVQIRENGIGPRRQSRQRVT